MKKKILVICLGLMSLIFFMHGETKAATLDKLNSGGKERWLNVERPLTDKDMAGRFVLLDFWTYGCINCIQIVPDLKYLEEKFGDRLLVIGVHSAKFKGEQGNDRILAAARRFGLNHPVINDSDFAVWDSFGIRAWPTLVLLGPDGDEISRYAGEGHRTELERDITAAISAQPITTLSVLPATQDEGKQTEPLRFPAKLTTGMIDGEPTPGPVFFIADTGHHRVLAMDANGKVHLVIGSGKAELKDGSFAEAGFNQPHAVVQLGDHLIVADTGNHALREIDLRGGKVNTLAGNGKRGSGKGVPFVTLGNKKFSGLPASAVELASPWDVIRIDMQTGPEIAIAMAGTHQIWLYDPLEKKLGVWAGSGREGLKDGAATQAELAQPSALAYQDERLYFADAESSSLRMLEKGMVKTLIGTGLFKFGNQDGVYPNALLQHPQGLTADSDKLYLADTYNNAIRVYDTKTGQLSTMKTEGITLTEPGDIDVKNGLLYVVDSGAHRIVRIDPASGRGNVMQVR